MSTAGRRWVLPVLVLLVGSGSVLTASAAGTDGAISSLVPIVPCRLADTRPETLVGSRSSPIGAGESVTFQVTGTNGNCTIPSSATGIASNVTIVNPNSSSFLTIYPADASRPKASNLNWTPQSSPTPNQVTVALSASGAIAAFNNGGTIDVIIDIVGYYTPTANGPAGPAGPVGPKGATGPQGAPGAGGNTGSKGPTGDTGQVGPKGQIGNRGPVGTRGAVGTTIDSSPRILDVAAVGGDYATVTAAMAAIGTTVMPPASSTVPYLIRVAPGVYDEGTGVVLKDDVSIRGSGQDVTTITAVGTAVASTTGTLRATSDVHAVISNLTIVNASSTAKTTGINLIGASSAGQLRIADTTIRVSGGDDSRGIYVGGYQPVIERDRIVVSGITFALGIVSGDPASVITVVDTSIDVNSTSASSAAATGVALSSGTLQATDVTISAAAAQAVHSYGFQIDGTAEISRSAARAAYAALVHGTATIDSTLLAATTTLAFGLASDGNVSVRDSTVTGAFIGGGTTTVSRSIVSSVQVVQGTMTCAYDLKPDGTALGATPTACS